MAFHLKIAAKFHAYIDCLGSFEHVLKVVLRSSHKLPPISLKLDLSVMPRNYVKGLFIDLPD